MKSGIPWHFEGISRQTREAAQEAARRAGMSVGEWLDSVILDSALHGASEPHDPAPGRPDEPTADRAAGRESHARLFVRPRYATDEDLRAADRDEDLPPRRERYGDDDSRYQRRQSDYPRPDYAEDDWEPRRRASDVDDASDDEDIRPSRGRYAEHDPSEGDGEPGSFPHDERFADEEDVHPRRRHSDQEDALRRAEQLAEQLSLTTLEDRYRPALDQGFAEVNDRLESLTRQLGQLAERSAALAQPPRPDARDDQTAQQLTEGISQLDRRLDVLIAEGRSAKTEMEKRVDAVDRAVADLGHEKPRPSILADPPNPLDQALMEIADRQRMLDGYAPAPLSAPSYAAMAAEQLPRARNQEFSGLEQQLRQINTQIETLRQPCGLDKAVETLRNDLAEIGVMLQEAMPRKAVEALEAEIRNLAERIDQSRHTGVDGTALTGLERGLAEVRDALRDLTPAENLVGVDRAVQELTQKVDLIANTGQDPAALRQLEGAIVTMRGIASHVASDDALSKLSEEMRALSDKVDRIASAAGGSALSALEERIATLADALEARNHRGQVVPHELETVVKGLVDKIERVQLSQGDHAALGHLEDRIAKLVEKLDASDARLNHLEAIERSLADLLIQIEHRRVPNLGAAAGALPDDVEALSRDVAALRQTEKKTLDKLEAVHGTLGHVVDRLAMIETDMRGPVGNASFAAPIGSIAAAPASNPVASKLIASKPVAPKPIVPEPPPGASMMTPTLPPIAEASVEAQPIGIAAPSRQGAPTATSAGERRPIDPSLPPDHPLEPGSGARARTSGSPADRIAASEAALAGAKPPVIPDPAGKSNFIAAARRAAQAAGREAPAKSSSAAPGDIASAAGRLASRVGKLRNLIAGGSCILFVLGAFQIARTLIHFDETDAPSQGAATRVATTAIDNPSPLTTPAEAPASEPAASPPPLPSTLASPSRQSVVLPAIDGSSIATPTPGIILPVEPARQPSPAAAAKSLPASLPAADREITGSVSTSVKPAGLAAPAAAPAPAADRLPTAFDASLRTAAAKGDRAAQYEVALRYAEGRGVSQSLTDAAEWFERAAKQGLPAAQFRLGGLYEKGLGVKKDTETARRLYLAAGEAGHAKALHNLAVLYAEGVDGKPDYQTAAKWFRKAADYGVTDSQYNLAILYARGIGVEQNLTEAYKWLALAARDGDADAAKKRDDLGARLDPQSLNAAKQAIQTWVAAPQPEAAVQVKAPAGGSSETAAAPAPAPKRKPPTAATAPKLDLATPRSAQ